MANTSNLRGYLKDVANSIRNVTGSNANILANEYDLIINNFILANETSINITPMVNAQHFGPAAGYSGYNSINIAAVDNVLEPNMTPANIVNGVNIFGVVGNYEGAAVPDGIYINENTPTKLTNQAIWVKVEDISEEPAFLDSIPSEIFSQYPGLTTFLASLTQAQKNSINSYSNHILMFDANFDGSNPSVYIICTNGEFYDYPIRSTSSMRYFSPNQKNGKSYDYFSISGTCYYQKPVYTNSSLTTVLFPANLELTTVEHGIHVDVGNNRYVVYTDDTNTGFVKKIDSVGLTATANTILANKTALVGDVVLTGTMNNYGSVNITPSITTQSMNAGFYNSINISAISNTLEPNMTPENIANGVNIFGVIGNMTAGEDLNNELNAQNLVIANLENQINELSGIINNAGTGSNAINYITANYYEKAMLIGEAFVSSTGTTNDLYLLYLLKPDFSNTSAKLFGAAGAVRGALPAVELSDNRAINLSNAFLAHSNLVYGPNLTTQNVTDMSNMYQNCSRLITVANYNTINVTNMAFMFNNCLNLTSVPNFDTSNVINMGNMFNGWVSNKTIPITSIPNFNTINVTDMSKMLRGTNITDLPNFNMSNVVEASSMCTKCIYLVNIPDLNLPNTINAPDMFAGCTSLINVPNIEMNQATNVSSMFKDNPNLVNVGTINMTNVGNASQMFRNDINLVNVPEFGLSNTAAILSSMFDNCNSLSNESVINIINMCINANVASAQKNLMPSNTFSPLYETKFDNSYYTDYHTALTAAGWTY